MSLNRKYSKRSISLIAANLTLDLPFWLVSDPFNFLTDADNREGLVFTAAWALDLIAAPVARLTNLKRSLAGKDFKWAKNCYWSFLLLHRNAAGADSNVVFRFSYQKHTLCSSINMEHGAPS
jgi:hypothetical protein